MPPDDRIVGVGREMTYWPVPIVVRSDCAACVSSRSRSRAELLEDAERLVQMALGDRARAGLRHQPPEREVAEARLIPLAEQIEQRRALREVVVGVGGAAGPSRGARRAAGRYSPHAAGAIRGSMRVGGRREPLLRPAAAGSRAISASAAMSVACSASNGGAPAWRISSTRATASSSVARAAARAARRGTRTDHSYHWLVWRP